MIDFDHARKNALEELQNTNTVSVLDAREKKIADLLKYPDVWRIKTEINFPGNEVREIVIYVCLPADFPLVLPRLYLGNEDYNLIKFIPHVNVKKYICLFDDETIIVDAQRPADIIKACLSQARTIIESGLHKRNTADFKDEFIAYWEEKYESNDKIVTGLDMINGKIEPGSTVHYLFLEQPYRLYSFILHNGGNEFERFKKYLKDEKVRIDEMEAFYLGELENILPPYNVLNKDVAEVVNANFPDLFKKFEQFINLISYPKLILFSIDTMERTLYFGWRIFRLKLDRNGYRQSALSNLIVYNTFQKTDPAGRLKFEKFTKERMTLRTDGFVNNPKITKLAFAGLGSIGSNLLRYLLSLDLDEILLIDPDILGIENTNRHLLGMEFIGDYKVDAIKTFILRDNPLLKIHCHQSSVVRIIQEKITLVNDMDFVFVAIGKNNIEEYLLSAMKDNVIKKPVFFLWVEPYLCGGHCLFVNPNHKIEIAELYKDGLFMYNIIDPEEYKDPNRQLLFREAGCQASYVPYGKLNITLFLSKLFPEINKLMTGKDNSSKCLSWKGNQPVSEKLNLNLSSWAKDLPYDDIYINEL